MTETEQPKVAARTSLDKRWVVRMVLITVVLWAFGGWAFYDALIKYPQRGRRAAERYQLQYLEIARESGRLWDSPVPDPAEQLAQLRARDDLDLSVLERARLDWLDVLATPGLGLLKADHTRMEDPDAEYRRLTEVKDTKGFPAPLSKYDILVQWAICAVCWALGLWMLVLFVTVRSKVYRWDPATKTLTLPGGRALGPDGLDKEEPADLSKWHKFIVFLRPREGGPVRLDLFRYDPLESWVVALVKSANADFELPEDSKAREAAASAAAPEAEGEPERAEGSSPAAR